MVYRYDLKQKTGAPFHHRDQGRSILFDVRQDRGKRLIKLLVCDDHDLVRAGLIRILLADGRFSIEAEASTIAELESQISNGVCADVIVLDLVLGQSCVADGCDQVQALQTKYPTVPIVVVSMHDDPVVAHAVLTAGARGYVTKDSSSPVLIDAIIQVCQGHRYVVPKLIESLFCLGATGSQRNWRAELTPREYEVFKRIVAGQRIKSIAIDLNVSIKTVSTHKVRLMDKLGVANNADLIRFAIKNGMS
jgi:DNA-binding NarL/FixJ family response regulator